MWPSAVASRLRWTTIQPICSVDGSRTSRPRNSLQASMARGSVSSRRDGRMVNTDCCRETVGQWHCDSRPVPIIPFRASIPPASGRQIAIDRSSETPSPTKRQVSRSGWTGSSDARRHRVKGLAWVRPQREPPKIVSGAVSRSEIGLARKDLNLRSPDPESDDVAARSRCGGWPCRWVARRTGGPHGLRRIPSGPRSTATGGSPRRMSEKDQRSSRARARIRAYRSQGFRPRLFLSDTRCANPGPAGNCRSPDRTG